MGKAGLKLMIANLLISRKTLRAMTAEDLRLANSQRIQVVVAQPGDTYKSLAQKVSVKSYPEDTLRVINGHHPRGEPRAGDFVKIIQ